MADRKISELTNLTGANLADDDEFPLVDTSADETKAITFGEFKTALDTATGFVRITGDTMTGNLSMGDNVKAIFGAGPELQIYSDGTSGIIKDVGSGDIKILADDFYVQNAAGSSTLISVLDTGKVGLGFAGSEKLATESGGVNITGTLTSDGLTVGDNSTSEIPIYFNSSSTDFSIGANGNNFILAQTTGDLDTNQLLTVTNSGLVGIGTSSPSGKLSISGVTATNEQVHATFTNAQGAKTFAIGAGQSGVTNNGFVIRNVTDNTFPLVISDAGVTSFGAGNVGIGVVPSTTNYADWLFIGSAGNSIFGASNDMNMTANAYYNTNWTYGTSTAASRYQQSSGQHIWSYAASGTAGNTISFSEAMRIDSGGNVGIGNSTPSNNHANANNLVVGNGTAGGIANYVGTGLGWYAFSRANANNSDAFDGGISYDGSRNLMFHTNAGSERMRIDSSGNLLVGKTSTGISTVGAELKATGELLATVNNDACAFLNRKSSDGTIIALRKDGSTVGSIGIQSTGFYIDGESGHAGIRFAGNEVSPRDNGSDADGVVSLGESDKRFKDLYLSGGVVFGDAGGSGTSTSNTLDSYEEGTWAPYWSSTGATFSYLDQFGNYVKVGNMVHAQFYLRATASGTTSNSISMQGFPFASADLSPYNQWGGSAWISNDINSTLLKSRNNTAAIVYKNKSGTPESLDAAELSGVYFVGSVSYRTA